MTPEQLDDLLGLLCLAGMVLVTLLAPVYLA